MPLFIYLCEICGGVSKAITPEPKNKVECQCGALMVRQLPKTTSSTTYETRDRYRGKQLPKNQDAKIKERSTKHHNQYELAEKIDRHGVDEMIKRKWDKKIDRS